MLADAREHLLSTGSDKNCKLDYTEAMRGESAVGGVQGQGLSNLVGSMLLRLADALLHLIRADNDDASSFDRHQSHVLKYAQLLVHGLPSHPHSGC